MLHNTYLKTCIYHLKLLIFLNKYLFLQTVYIKPPKMDVWSLFKYIYNSVP